MSLTLLLKLAVAVFAAAPRAQGPAPAPSAPAPARQSPLPEAPPPSDEDQELEAQGIDGKEPLGRFLTVSPGIYRSAQPNREGFAKLAELGVKTILNLRSTQTRGEPGEVRRRGMSPAHVAMAGFKFPTFSQVDRALLLLADPALRPIHVHCAHGRDRTGTVVAAYRMVHEGVDPRAAAAEAKSIGCCPRLWKGDLDRWLLAYRRHREGRPPGGSLDFSELSLELQAPPGLRRAEGVPPGRAGRLFDGSNP